MGFCTVCRLHPRLSTMSWTDHSICHSSSVPQQTRGDRESVDSPRAYPRQAQFLRKSDSAAEERGWQFLSIKARMCHMGTEYQRIVSGPKYHAVMVRQVPHTALCWAIWSRLAGPAALHGCSTATPLSRFCFEERL